MRIDPETFLVLTLLMGTGAAVGVAVVTSRADETEVVEEPAEPVAQAPATAEPAPPPEPTTPAVPVTPPAATPEVATTGGATEAPWVDPFPIIPDDPNAVPGPDVEGF